MNKFRSRRASRQIEDQSIPNNDDSEFLASKTEVQNYLNGIIEEDISSLHSSNSRLSPDTIEPIYDDCDGDAFDNTKSNDKFPWLCQY